MAQLSVKRQQIDRSVNTMVKTAAISIFVTILSLISAHALTNKLSFQNKVIKDKTTARNQLNSDVTATNQLTAAYQDFNGSTTNLLGATTTGEDNDNAKIILDALPSSYDYPAMITSVQDLLSNQGVKIDSIGGTDNTAMGGSNSAGSSTTTTPAGQSVAMPFTFSVDGPYQNIQNVITEFQKSIRPFQFQTISLSGDQSDVNLTATAQTFYQPGATFKISTEKVQ